MDRSFLSILVLIYQSSVTGKRLKEWPLLAFGIVFLSGIITLVSNTSIIYTIWIKCRKLKTMANETTLCLEQSLKL